ncbi:MAG: MFS transporter [Candidatus Levybacteria bacterium]|nr:MFS transporter [Candidatus Levybacteria bacterium]
MPKILKNHQFLRLWGNQVLLQVAFNMCNFSALLILADRTHSPFIQAQFYTALILPAILFGLIAGPIVDMTNRKQLILLTDFLLALLFFSYIFMDGKIWLAFLIAFLTSSVARFFTPAEAASIPLIVEKETLNHANTFFLFTLMGSVLLGYAIAGPVMQLFGGLGTDGEYAPFILGSIILAIGFILMWGMPHIETVKPKLSEGSVVGKTFILFWQTIQEVKTNKRVSLPIAILVFIELMVGLMSIMLLEYIRRYVQLPLTSISYVLMGPLVFGLIIGILLLVKVEKLYGARRSIFRGIVGTGALLFVMGITPIIVDKFGFDISFVRFMLIGASFVMGILVVLVAVQSRTILQTSSRQEMHGRIFSFLDIMIAFVTPIPVLIMGFLADKVSLLATLMSIGFVIMLLTYLGYVFIYKRDNGYKS